MFTRAELEQRRSRLSRDLSAVAKLIPKTPEGEVFRAAMESVAWGRYENEPQPDEHKDRVAMGYGELIGRRSTLLRLARALNLTAVDRALCQVTP